MEQRSTEANDPNEEIIRRGWSPSAIEKVIYVKSED